MTEGDWEPAYARRAFSTAPIRPARGSRPHARTSEFDSRNAIAASTYSIQEDVLAPPNRDSEASVV